MAKKTSDSRSTKPLQNEPAQHKSVTKHAGKMKTISTKINYETDHTHSYLKLNEHKILNAFERLAAILRMAKTSNAAYTRISQWHSDVNLAVAQVQLDTLHEQRVEKEKNFPVTGEFLINTPDSYFMEFEVSHPVGLTITQLIVAIDKEVNAIEKLFMFGFLDDLEYEHACKQAAAIVTGVTDRIMKVTSPGKREGGQFQPRYYLEFLRDPHFNMLSLCALPYETAKMILTEEQMKLIIKTKEDSTSKVA
ncbi:MULTISPECIES: hypothetical protein [Pseudoalteromonas]|uniref:Uncharacterized protein n=1 Tax=Pseudoalteromonas arctica A 37-1-2 TaxID=1117313 RepID=A0A290SCK3_9GAMM|nr:MULTISPECIES: hypothetical protein [Pseudoalteromonas]OUX96056.1 MAG: hypothetical protein CBC03_00220 [Pseudoalteromonas sp. TMED43]ATC88997.1 hypothetical protein PARC_p0020 [Pseudoalteromonas arctica A 37-1-2]MDC9567057.1 hypothetical protein [Pseudoalteromonas sp. GAB2316C]MDC9571285.1 hypothetical protein [Pseudoalteromonas sp. GABNB9D]MDC9575527.1 hypothetical protein [Pseudoalteromonas sp. GABNS16A]|tara:strand:- start:1616 stop:2365 length:750 start_codon:yes stop_codon:yes gene_type:complete